MKLNTMEDLFVAELRDMYHAEKQLVKALPKLAKAATRPELQTAFEQHLQETINQVSRLEQVFASLELKARAETCEAMEGLIEEGKELIDAKGEDVVRDAGLIAAAQKVEHYEIASYGCLITWAKELGHEQAANLLGQNLEEEKAADQKLTTLAEARINAEAEHVSSS